MSRHETYVYQQSSYLGSKTRANLVIFRENHFFYYKFSQSITAFLVFRKNSDLVGQIWISSNNIKEVCIGRKVSRSCPEGDRIIGYSPQPI